jgi:hypothetical protein
LITNNKTKVEPAIKSGGLEEEALDVADARKHFVEPEISLPVDVLEATTFFQVATSGSTT